MRANSWATCWLLACACMLHYALGAAVGLSVDEAHYALYAKHLALSYFDHPPLVGWVQWPLVALQAPVHVLRWLPELLWLATAMLVFQIAERLQALTAAPRDMPRDMSPDMSPVSRLGAGFWAVLVVALAPLLHVLGIGLLPDTLLMFFTALLMWQLLGLMAADALHARGASSTAASPLRWLALGLTLGLAGLSKYTAIFAALALAVCLLTAHGVRLLRSPLPWVAVLVAVLVVSPVAIWNYHNGWISFVYQTQHGKGGSWRVLPFVQFLVVQLLAYGPLLLWGVAGAWALRGTPHRSLWALFALPFVVLAFLSGGGSGLPHWTAPAWVALAPLAGLGLQRYGCASASAWRKRGIAALIALQLTLCLALMGLMASGGVPWLNPDPNTSTPNPASVITPEASQATAESPNPFADLHGWDQAGARALVLAQRHNLHSVSVQNWTLASRIGWYAQPLPVHVLEDRFDQFDFWAGDLPQGGSTLLVDWSQMAYETPLAPHGFTSCTLLETLPITHWGRPLSTFSFYDCRQWAGTPQPQLRTP
jgi:4-amino-4-deoxy-L-arabinose transferase-like glycosyltransferase